MWCTIRNFLFRIVLGIVKADHRIKICNKSGKAVLSDYIHPRRVPLKEDRLEQPRTDFRVQSVILLTNSGTMTSETLHSDLCIRKCACGTSCKWPFVLDWMLQSAQQCRYSMLGETNPKDDQDVSLSRERVSYEPLLRDMVIEVSKFEYSKHIVDRVCYGVLARWLEVANLVCAVHVIQGISTHQLAERGPMLCMAEMSPSH